MTDSSKPASASADMPNYYNPNDPEIEATARKIFTEYAGIPEEAIVPHVKAVVSNPTVTLQKENYAKKDEEEEEEEAARADNVLAQREKAWSLFPYPCIGQYAFVSFPLADHPLTPRILSRLRHDPATTLLDLGCCVGQDLRFLAHAGVPTTQLFGCDLEPGFFGLGHELFRDADRLPVEKHFRAGDWFDAGGESGICARLRRETEGGEGFDVIYAGSFFHLFDWEEQVQAWSRAVGLLKRKKWQGEAVKKGGEGAVILGRQTGVSPAAIVEHPAARSGRLYRHDEASLKKLITEVAGKTGVPLRAVMDKVIPVSPYADPNDRWNFFYFSVFVDE